MIERITIENFKRIEKIELELSKINVLVGANNSGKTSVLQAIQFAIGAVQTSQRYGAFISGDRASYSGAALDFQYLPILEIESLIYDKVLTQSKGSNIYFKEAVTQNELTVKLKRGKNRNIATSFEGIQLYRDLSNSEHPYCVFIPGLSGVALYEEFQAKAIVAKSATRGDSNLYLRNILYALHNDDDAWTNFEESVELFFPNHKLIVKYNPEIDERIEITIKKGNITLPLDAMGTSALQIIQILSYVYYFQPKLMILDEPDTHLHPNNQRKMIKEIIRLSVELDIQVILSTHSRHILDEIEDEGKIIWLSNGKIQKQENQYSKLLLELGALDKTDFLNNTNIKVVVCTEDERHLEALHAILKASSYNMENTIIIPYFGCDKIDNARLLSAFMEKYASDKTVIIHRDRDYLSNDEVEDFLKKLTSEKTKVFITSGTDIESIFLSAEHINYLFPAITVEEATVFIEEAISETRDKSLDKFINSTFEKTRERNVARINRECTETFNGSPLNYTYGKKALGLLKAKVQAKIGQNPELYKPSEFIRQGILAEYAVLSESN